MFKTKSVALLVIGAVFISASVAAAAGGAWDSNGNKLYYNDGNIGIGTKTPDKKLSVVGAVRGAYNAAENEYTEIGHGGGHGYINTFGDGELMFRHHGNTKMSLDATGNLDIVGRMTWGEKSSLISVPAAAFQPSIDGYDYANYGNAITNLDGSSDFYVASVQLPHGAVVAELSLYWNDVSTPNNAVCTLYRTSLDGQEVKMAEAASSGDTIGADSSTDTSIDYKKVNNSSYSYYVYLQLPDSNIEVYGATIRYTVTQPY